VTISPQSALLSLFSGLTLCCCLLTFTTVAHAEQSPLSGELATGIAFFGDDASTFEPVPSLDLGLTYVFTDYIVARAAVGVAVTGHHGPIYLIHTRAEAAVRAKLARFVPLFGAGASAWGTNPAVHALLGLGLELAPGWQLALDLRSGLYWDREDTHSGFTPYNEGQLRMSWPIR